jgi:hypothetical protein
LPSARLRFRAARLFFTNLKIPVFTPDDFVRVSGDSETINTPTNMENEEIRNQYDAFTRIEGFGTKYPDLFAPASRGRAQFALIGEVIAKMVANGVKKLAGKGGFHGGSGSKSLAAAALREQLRKIRKTAVAIAEADDLPEFDDKYVVPRSNSYEGLLTAARTFLQEATPHTALFIGFEMPADFITKLQAAILRLEKAGTDQDEGLSEQVGGTAELAANAAEGMKARKQLLVLVRNKLANDPGKLAEWKTASHITWPTSTPDEPSDPAPPTA